MIANSIARLAASLRLALHGTGWGVADCDTPDAIALAHDGEPTTTATIMPEGEAAWRMTIGQSDRTVTFGIDRTTATPQWIARLLDGVTR